MGDFNTEPTDTTLSDFCEIYNLKNIVQDKTCFNFLNIYAENLFEDGLHLNDDGKVILANNFIYVLNTFILWQKKL